MVSADWAEVQKQFVKYCFEQDFSFVLIPKDQMYEGQRQFRKELKLRWLEEGIEASQPLTAQPATAQNVGYSHISAVVKWFATEKGYGFAEAGLGQDIFIHQNVLEQAEILTINQGDTVICDIATGARGKLQAIAVHSVRRGQDQLFERPIEGVIEFFNSHKGYGFVSVEQLPEDVYLSSRTVENSGVGTLEAGDRVRVTIEPGRFGKGFMATSVERLEASITDAA